MPSLVAQPSKCLRCGRTLRVSEGYGPRCRAIIRRAAVDAALEGFTPAQRDKAAELIADGGLVPTSRPGVYRASGSKGDVTYLTHVKGQCSCPGGLHMLKLKPCYHALAVRIVTASKVA